MEERIQKLEKELTEIKNFLNSLNIQPNDVLVTQRKVVEDSKKWLLD